MADPTVQDVYDMLRVMAGGVACLCLLIYLAVLRPLRRLEKRLDALELLLTGSTNPKGDHIPPHRVAEWEKWQKENVL